jgi:ATP-dependent DNA ligase
MKQGIPGSSSFSFIEPMHAPTVLDLPDGRWLYEVKFDGYRALAFKSGQETRLVFRWIGSTCQTFGTAETDDSRSAIAALKES